jgi:AcrR family transcriptional regulator
MKKASVSRLHSVIPAHTPVKPRKMPVQSRSTETVRAIKQATIQVLLEMGVGRLTTTRVARRAGVSVGTLYQYYPNKNALLHAVITEHLGFIAAAMERACAASHGCSVGQMARTATLAFIDAKLRTARQSVALYAAAEAGDALTILASMRKRVAAALVEMLRSAPGVRFPDLETTVLVYYTAMAGTMREVLEAGASTALVEATRRELLLLAEGHLTRACGLVETANQQIRQDNWLATATGGYS